jgi:TonB family protein
MQPWEFAGDMLWGMRPLMLLVCASVAFAQQGEDARPLLQQVADAARNVKSWRAEYVVTVETTGEGVQSKTEMPVKETVQCASLARREATLAGTPVLIICDGTNMWTYALSAKQYLKAAGTTAACASYFSGWTRLMDGLQSAVITGSDTLVFEGVPTACALVRAENSTLTMTMCVDRSRSLILRETVEARAVPNPSSPNVMPSKMTILYSSIEKDPVLPPDYFKFEPPPESTLSAGPGVPAGNSPPGVFCVGHCDVTSSILLSKVEPTYTQEARAAKIEGAVVLYVEVAPDGVPQNIRVLRGLDPGLDQKAIEAVSKWRFQPAMKDGKPVTVAAQVEVNFRLL